MASLSRFWARASKLRSSITLLDYSGVSSMMGSSKGVALYRVMCIRCGYDSVSLPVRFTAIHVSAATAAYAPAVTRLVIIILIVVVIVILIVVVIVILVVVVIVVLVVVVIVVVEVI